MTKRKNRKAVLARKDSATATGSSTKTHIVVDKARGEMDVLANTASTGVATFTSYLLSTSFDDRWTGLSSYYQKWRIREIIFHYVPAMETNRTGRVIMGVVEDPDGTVPTTTQGLMMQRVSMETTGYAKASLRYRPTRSPRWFYTKDLSLNEDRLEYPGFLVVGTISFNVSIVPGSIWYEYVVEFCDPTNLEAQLVNAPRLRDIAKSGKGVTYRAFETDVRTKADPNREDDGIGRPMSERLEDTGEAKPNPYKLERSDSQTVGFRIADQSVQLKKGDGKVGSGCTLMVGGKPSNSNRTPQGIVLLPDPP